MVINAKVLQETPQGAFEVTLLLSDPDAKAIMNACPNVSFQQLGTIYFREMNPVHTMPGHYRANLQTPLKRTVAKDSTLSLTL